MPVVPAGVHAALVRGLVLQVAQLVHRQAIHVGAQPDRAARAALFAANDADHAGLSEARVRLDAELPQILGYQSRRATLFKRQLRVRVQVAPDVRQLGVVAADVLDGRAELVGGVHGASIRSLGSTA